MKERLKSYYIFKLDTDRFIERNEKISKIIPLTLTMEEARRNCELVSIQSNQLTSRILDYFEQKGIKDTGKYFFENILVNLHVPEDARKRGESDYKRLAEDGISLNGKRFVRLFSGSGQIRRNTITFIRDDLYEPILNSLLCGLTIDDFGNDYNPAKFSAYAGLNMSACHLLKDEYAPKVCVVDDFEQIRPSHIVNHVSENEVDYITLPEDDYILTDDQSDFTIDGDKAISAEGVPFKIRHGIKKHIEQASYDSIVGAPALNSFDGQGLMCPEWAERVSRYLGLNYIVSELIVRAPWVKGLLVNIPFHEYFHSLGISEIKDSFGKVRKIDDIDCIISKSQFKMFKVYKAKCEKLGVNAWDFHQEKMKENHLLWGIAKINGAVDDDIKALNYQYLQALQLEHDDIDTLCERTEEYLSKLNSGDIEEVYNNLFVNSNSQDRPDDENDNTPEDDNSKKLFQKVIEADERFINDKYIRELIYKECSAKLNAAKLGKILVRGNFQFCVSDPVAQLEWISKNHCDIDIDVVGVVPEACVYNNYWLDCVDCTEDIVLMRSPLIDRNEISKRKLVQERQHYFRYLSSGIVLSIHDLTALQCGGCDFDGDILFSTNDRIISKGCLDYATTKPLYYALSSTDLVGKITNENLILADVRGLNSAVGSISNRAGSLYAMLVKYQDGTPEYKKIYDSIIALGQIVGMEIDRIKTAVAPTFPVEWQALQVEKNPNLDSNTRVISSEEECQGIYRHNKFVPDTKPYYLRYNYDYLDKAIKKLNKDTNTVCKHDYGFKFDKLINRVNDQIATDEEIKYFETYLKAYPVIDSDCIVNYISHKFEEYSKRLHSRSMAEGVNMLSTLTLRDIKINAEKKKQVESLIKAYMRFRRDLAKAVNKNYKESNKEKQKKIYNAKSAMNDYYEDLLLKLFDNDIELTLTYLVSCCNSESTIWELFYKSILQLLRGCY